MQRKRGGLVPVGEVIGGLDVPVPAIPASPQARHHFTLSDQVNQLVETSEEDPDLGFMARLMALCSLPAPHQPRRPAPVQARQRSVQAHHDCRWRQQTPLWQPAAPDPGLALYRSGADPKPRVGLGD